ncbi:MAG: hypothetical protein HC767_07110 [Akkermansiaceae bacterium]|nr:hypothetical protein [Akkermansiaceae bacterium]
MDNYMPTDVVMNFGVLMRFAARDTTCGTENENNINIGPCPYMPDVCKHLTGKHNYNLVWQTTPPSLEDENTGLFNYSMGPGHNLNPVSKCGLRRSGILDTNRVLERLHSSSKQRAKLYLNRHSMVVDAHHALNWNPGE